MRVNISKYEGKYRALSSVGVLVAEDKTVEGLVEKIVLVDGLSSVVTGLPSVTDPTLLNNVEHQRFWLNYDIALNTSIYG